MPLAIAFIVLAASWRIAALHLPWLLNFAPLMALTYCSAVYLRDKRLWILPLVALTLSDLYLNHYYATRFGEPWTYTGTVIRLLSFAAGLLFGWMVSERRSWIKIFGGALASSLLFYLVTNTGSWRSDPAYAQTFAGWLQAMTVGRPEYPSTFFFFRKTLASDLIFTGLFAVAMELAARRSGQVSLLEKSAAIPASSGR